eukprot:TRINITY_DN828_c0_g1_i1.p2 TRINITY_DN828_c0_g1~~TRINITY_DN828_c0_g1_i1.p2  ORF type:complete len:61 (+),score=2.22 TRINITY_DN828_c0_g1_i1:48-230(+)
MRPLSTRTITQPTNHCDPFLQDCHSEPSDLQNQPPVAFTHWVANSITKPQNTGLAIGLEN